MFVWIAQYKKGEEGREREERLVVAFESILTCNFQACRVFATYM